jgi:hypothetical protein
MPRYPVKHGLHTYDQAMTKAQARRLGASSMPADLKRAGFTVHVSVVPPWISGADHDYLRINYSRSY